MSIDKMGNETDKVYGESAFIDRMLSGRSAQFKDLYLTKSGVIRYNNSHIIGYYKRGVLLVNDICIINIMGISEETADAFNRCVFNLQRVANIYRIPNVRVPFRGRWRLPTIADVSEYLGAKLHHYQWGLSQLDMTTVDDNTILRIRLLNNDIDRYNGLICLWNAGEVK